MVSLILNNSFGPVLDRHIFYLLNIKIEVIFSAQEVKNAFIVRNIPSGLQFENDAFREDRLSAQNVLISVAH